MSKKYDFSGWATKNNLRCSDGRTIRQNAFIDNDGQTVPLVWQHQHDSPANVLGHALLENRENGVYAYCTFNDTPMAQHAKELVKHKDVSSLSIYANQLKQDGGNVLHGVIREVSLVLAGANPGAFIEYTSITHGDGEYEEANIYHEEDDDELVLEHSGCGSSNKHCAPPEKKKELEHSKCAPQEKKELEHAKEENFKMAENEKTLKDIFDELTEEQKQAVYFMIGKAVEDAKGGKNNNGEEEEPTNMKHNVFENDMPEDTLSHAEMASIIGDAKRYGSLKESFLAHTATYGIENISYLFPDAQTLNSTPGFIKRKDEWVDVVMSGVKHSPFSRVRSIFANLTADEARAKGYVKGNAKVDEVIVALKRETSPTTIYKKQKLDRDDIIDITDFDVVAWLKTEMRMMLDEEIARAILVGDGRSASSNDKINEQNIRPIWTDDSLYTVKSAIVPAQGDTDSDLAHAFIQQAIRSRKNYRGAGNPVLFTTEDWLTECLLLEDVNGRVIYDSIEKLATAMRVSKIVTVPVMEGRYRTATESSTSYRYDLMGLIVNLSDYNVGADKGGAVNMFDDFDIDYNQQKYLIETRCSGAMVTPYGAIAIEKKTVNAG